jgi:hypothetical protein
LTEEVCCPIVSQRHPSLEHVAAAVRGPDLVADGARERHPAARPGDPLVTGRSHSDANWIAIYANVQVDRYHALMMLMHGLWQVFSHRLRANSPRTTARSSQALQVRMYEQFQDSPMLRLGQQSCQNATI